MKQSLIVSGVVVASFAVAWWGWPAVRRRWPDVSAWLWVMAGNSRTIAVAYAAELVALLDEAKLLDWSQLVGAERAGRVVAIMGAIMMLLRFVTRTPVSFRLP